MKNLKAKMKKQAGFTLIEMLIVVAIVAILIAISIPIVGNALESARDATDQANERAAKAEAVLVYMDVADDYTNKPVADATTGEISGWYDAVNGKLVSNAGKPKVAYGKCTGNGCTAEYTNSADHTNSIIKVTVSKNGEVKVEWDALS